jgi:hypothetical protein
VLRDVTNPSRSHNLNRQMLTQQHLERVAIDDRCHVDYFLRRVAHRLLGGVDTIDDPAGNVDTPVDLARLGIWRN